MFIIDLDNDRIIGHINQVSIERSSVLKRKGFGGKPRMQSKTTPRSPINTRRESKEKIDSKTYLNIMENSDLTVPKKKSGLRKVKLSS